MKRRHGIALLGALGLAGTFIAVMPPAQAAAEPVWEACPATVITAPHTAQCTKVQVPLDYSDPDGATIELMVSRIASKKPEKRRGILMFNPGGPGGTGLDQPAFLANRGMPASVLDSYDLIGMDTRGVGHSSPVSCGFRADDAYWANIPPYALNDTTAVAEQSALAAEVAQRCAGNDSDGRLRHITTANMARDLDRIRVALGEEKASFYGASYGSALGAAYVSLFPESTDRIVLDSNMADTHLDRASLRRYAHGFEETFPDFAKWAAERHGSYGLGRTAAQVRKTYFAIAERLDRAPAADGTTGAHFRYLTFAGVYHPMQYGRTAHIWQSLLGPATVEAPPVEPGTPHPVDNALTVYLATTCNDVDWPEDLATYQRDVAADRKRYPLYGAAAANILPCAHWKWEPAEPPVPISKQGAANILLLQNRHDPVTPAVNAALLQERFGKRAKLVTAEESGHGVYVLSDNACALELTTAYLVDGRMPARDTTCRN
ncbi:alpha/beta hydrolase [Actinoplanes sp. G11-F43]|uniref:alpha/beta hydrolase n=1 Tax=Actinoplanes sp. G11-F43 TaxID=3424130 RepID=UPI003D33C628